MSDPPKDLTVFFIRFMFSAVFFGFVFALIGLRTIDSLNATNLGAWIAITLIMSSLTAWCGDEAWERLIGFFRWW